MRLWCLVMIGMVSLSSPALAQARKTAPNRGGEQCVDVASLKQGKSVRGLVISGDGTSNSPWLMAAERELVRTENPALYNRSIKAESQKATQATSELVARLDQELALPEVEGAYKKFLQRELERVTNLANTQPAADGLTTRFMWLELTNKECSGLRRASADAQRVAVWAWSENIPDVTKRQRADLERELKDANIDVNLKVPDLSTELPLRPESEQNWTARLAIMRYSLIGPIDFQGSSGTFVRVGDNRGVGAAEIGPLIQKMMGGSMEELLKDLDPTARPSARKNNPGQWYSSVISEVQTLGRREFRITRLDPDPTGQAATVETALVARLPQKEWRIVWSSSHTCTTAEITPKAEEKVTNDPQVKTALGLLSALGAGADAEIKKAIRFGAATMTAQEAADSAFISFRDRYTTRVDGPPLP